MTTDTGRCNPPAHTAACHAKTGIACGGMVCEKHPDLVWPDGDPDCVGPGMPCLHPSNMYLHKDEALRQAKTDLRAIERVAMTRRNEGDRYGGNEASGRVWRGTLQFIATSAAVAIAVIDEVLP